MGAKLINLIDKPLIYALNFYFSCKIIDYLIIFFYCFEYFCSLKVDTLARSFASDVFYIINTMCLVYKGYCYMIITKLPMNRQILIDV